MDSVKFAYCEQPLSGAFVVPHPARPNEDTFSICSLRTGALGRASFFGVFDGHNGSEVSKFLASDLHQYVEACATSDSGLISALNRAFQLADLALDAKLNCPNAGSTATVALLSAHDITVAHCGDSRALLCRAGKVYALTEDHRPARPDERARVLRSGGQFLWNEGERVMGVLATTRGFGDRDLKQFGVTAEPEVTITSRSPDDEFLILATDGVFNVLSNEEVADVARRIVRRSAERGSPREVAIRLAASAIARFSRDRNSRDDITVIVVDIATAWKRIPTLSWEGCQGGAQPVDVPHSGLGFWTPKAGGSGGVMFMGADRGRCRVAGMPGVAAMTAGREDDTAGEQNKTPEMNILAAMGPGAAATVGMRRWLSAPLRWDGGVGKQWGSMDMHQLQNAPWIRSICTELPYADVTSTHPNGQVMGGVVAESACLTAEATGPNSGSLRTASSGVPYDVTYYRGIAIAEGDDLSSATVCTAPDDHPVGQPHDVIMACPIGQPPTGESQPPLTTDPSSLERKCATCPSGASNFSSMQSLATTHGAHAESQQPPCTTDLRKPYCITQCTEAYKAEGFIATSPQSVPDVPCPPASPPPLLPRRASEKQPAPAPAAWMMELDSHDLQNGAHSPAAPAAVSHSSAITEIPTDPFVVEHGEVSDVIATDIAESSSASGGGGCEQGNRLGMDMEDATDNIQTNIQAAEISPVRGLSGVGRELGQQPKILRTKSCAQENVDSKSRRVEKPPHLPLTQTQRQEAAGAVEERRQHQPQHAHCHLRHRHRSYTGVGMDSERSSFRTTRSIHRAGLRRASCVGVSVSLVGGGGAGGGGILLSGAGSAESGGHARSTKGHFGRGFGLSADGRVMVQTVSLPASFDLSREDLTGTVL